jgi:hypothetical protein
MRRILLAGLLGLAVGCGGSGASTAPSAAIVVVDGVTGAPLPGEAPSARPGETVTVERTGYLRRDTVLASDGVISLWPVTVDEAYVRALVYSETAARNRLVRWTATVIPVARDLPPEAAEVVRPWVTLVPSDAPLITIAVDPGDPEFSQFPPDTIAFALRQVSDADAHIVSARLVFRSEAALRRPGNLPHEMGHALGLQHSARIGDLMFPTDARQALSFSSDERVLLTMMYGRRRSGQGAPDDDRALGPAATGVVRSIFP